jgi:gluconokinase
MVMTTRSDLPGGTIVLVMGVAGSGKSTIGGMLAGRLGWEYVEADAYHPPGNLAKMRAGEPLTDADRWPWLDALAAEIDALRAALRSAVVTCSALKRAYRDRLRAGRTGVRLVYLDGDRELIEHRLTARHGHFFPGRLIDSQFRDLEPPAPDEHAVVVRLSDAIRPSELVTEIVDHLTHTV